MNHDKFLSIVTISFNQGDYLPQAIGSVLSQKEPDVEYIVVDPGSTDGSREILRSHGEAIDHLILDTDSGPADGLNKGFAMASGRYGYFLNSDDLLLPRAVEKLRRLWRLHADADALLCRAWMVDAEGEPLRELRPTRATRNGLAANRVAIVQQGLSFRMERFRQVGGFNPVNRTCWDYELICQLALAKARFQICPEAIGAFRMHTSSLSGGVGGAAHSLRVKADYQRIQLGMTKGAPVYLKRARTTFNRTMMHLLAPARLISLIHDRLMPSAMQRRWREDMKNL